MLTQIDMHKFEKVIGQCNLVISAFRSGAAACSSIIGRNDPVTGFGQGCDDMPPLIASVGEAVNEQYRTFLINYRSWTIDIVNSNFASIIYEDAAVAPIFVLDGCGVQRWHFCMRVIF